MRLIYVFAAVALSGCAEVGRGFSELVPAGEVHQVYADVARGDVVYTGLENASAIGVGVSSWARGASRARAVANEAGNSWGIHVVDGVLNAWSHSGSELAGVDFDLNGPGQVDVEMITLEGNAFLYDVDGHHVVTADAVVADGLRGDADLYAARGGIQVGIAPDFGSVVILEAVGGDVVLGMPYGLQYDLVVHGDPDYPMDVQDLGFEDIVLAPGFFAAETGGRNVTVQVFVENGGFFLYEVPPS